MDAGPTVIEDRAARATSSAPGRTPVAILGHTAMLTAGMDVPRATGAVRGDTAATPRITGACPVAAGSREDIDAAKVA